MSVTQAQWETLMRSIEGPYAAAVTAEKNRYITEAATVFPVTQRLEDKLFDYHYASMVVIAQRYQGESMKAALKQTFKAKSVQVKADWDKLWLYLIRKWMSEYGLQAAKETAETTRKDMQSIINAALAHDAEFNPAQVAAALLKAKDLSPFRAETIARTETHNAMMYASVEGAAKLSRDEGVVFKKKWVPVQDERTRANHSAMSSHPAIAMDADFNVGGVKMSRPGDPRGGAANCINCRCVLTYEVAE